jgi:hypothetical protein
MENALRIDQFNNACKQIRVPFSSTDEEKVKAIQIIAAHDTEEGVATLIKAFHMVREPLAAQRTSTLMTTTRGGVVANSAGIALAQSKNPYGLDYLLSVASSRNESSLQREVAVRSLASARNKKALNGILNAMKDDDDAIIRAALDSCVVALRMCDESLKDDVNAILMNIFKLAFTQTERYVPDDIAVQAYGLLITYATDEVMHCLVQSITTNSKTPIATYYYRALMECSSPNSPRFIIRLMKLNLPELSWYSEMSRRLKLSSDPVVQRIAKEILEDTTIKTRIRATLDSGFAKRALEMKRACREILGL